MADNENGSTKVEHNYYENVPFAKMDGFYVKGLADVGWGMKNRLAKIFNPKSGNTVMLAFDHGYIMGSTAGLERLDLAIPPLVEDFDVLMATRGALRSCIPAYYNKGIALRCSAGSSVVDEDMSREVIGVNVEDAIRMNASCMAIQTFIGTPAKRRRSIICARLLMPVIDTNSGLGVVAVGKRWNGQPGLSAGNPYAG